MGARIALHHGNEAVFLCSVLLIGIDLAFIAFFLPESLGAGEESSEECGGAAVGGEGLSKEQSSRKVSSAHSPDAFGAFQVIFFVDL